MDNFKAPIRNVEEDHRITIFLLELVKFIARFYGLGFKISFKANLSGIKWKLFQDYAGG